MFWLQGTLIAIQGLHLAGLFDDFADKDFCETGDYDGDVWGDGLGEDLVYQLPGSRQLMNQEKGGRRGSCLGRGERGRRGRYLFDTAFVEVCATEDFIPLHLLRRKRLQQHPKISLPSPKIQKGGLLQSFPFLLESLIP
jgi:hypothetical protein